ncbi:MAG: nucleotidyltransferase domain-containing protein [Nanoarchaeota archaeon]|nr:nucleotidyltransferase domain-containing protein [Nanoarchaeota archaeon]
MLKQIFTSTNRIKIMQLLFFSKKETYLREIAKEMKIPVSAVKREIDNLEKIGIINVKNRKIKMNKKCNILDDLKNIFIKTDFLSYPIRDSLKGMNAKFILIFGSFAKGKYNSESDIDLLVIGNIKQSELFKKLRVVEKDISRDINPIVWSVEELFEKRKGKFAGEIFSGKILMLKGDENELRRIIKK